MDEINKKTLIEALSSLKEYDPPETIWDRIDLDIDLGKQGVIQSDKLYELPEYDPPLKVWNFVQKRLDGAGGEERRIVSMWRRPLAIAAAFIVLIAAYMVVQNMLDKPIQNEPFVISYSVEELDERLMATDWQEDAEAFEQYKFLCEAKQYVCEQPEFQLLQMEFEELSEAISELEYAIGDYGANADLVLQVKEIELERTDIFKKMMVMLI